MSYKCFYPYMAYRWTLWYLKGDGKASNWEDNLHNVITFDTVSAGDNTLVFCVSQDNSIHQPFYSPGTHGYNTIYVSCADCVIGDGRERNHLDYICILRHQHKATISLNTSTQHNHIPNHLNTRLPYPFPPSARIHTCLTGSLGH